jgi:molybdopterin/thiamine biosynthesis adenylyltransferase
VQPKVCELNPNVNLTVMDQELADLDEATIHAFDVVLLHGQSETTALRINSLCRSKQPTAIKFFWSDSVGDEALFFADFGSKFSYRKDPSTNPAQSGSSAVGKPLVGLVTLQIIAANIVAIVAIVVAAPVALETVDFPSLQHTLSKTWRSIPARQLSPIYIRFCIVARFR